MKSSRLSSEKILANTLRRDHSIYAAKDALRLLDDGLSYKDAIYEAFRRHKQPLASIKKELSRLLEERDKRCQLTLV